MIGLSYTYRHKDGSRLIVKVSNTPLTDQEICDLRKPTDEQTYHLLYPIVAYYFDWVYESSSYTDRNGRHFIVMETKGKKPVDQRETSTRAEEYNGTNEDSKDKSANGCD